jgi:prophage regulatory protein
MRILRRPKVREKTGLSDPSLDRMESVGKFPRRVPLGSGRAIGWVESEIDQWIEARIRARDQAGKMSDEAG